MSNRLPQPGGDNGDWGDILNAYLSVSLSSTGELNPSVVGSSQLDSPTQSAIALANTSVQTVNGHTPTSGSVTLTASDVSALTQTTADSRYIQSTQLGASGGVATLTGTTLTSSQLPSGVVSVTGLATNIAAAYPALSSTPGAAINQAISDASTLYTAGGTVQELYLPGGVYQIETPIVPQNGVHLRGAGKYATTIKSTSTQAAFIYIGTQSTPLTDFQLTDFTIDSSAQTGAYSDTMKNIFFQYIYRCNFKRLYCYNAYATSLGADYPEECVFEDCDFVGGGRGLSGTPVYDGGNGLGCLLDSTGPYGDTDTWALRVTRCTAINCKDYGFLIENSSGTPSVQPANFTDCYATGSHMGGFMDSGCYGTVFTGCTATANTGEGFVIAHGDVNNATFSPSTRGTMIGCVSLLNGGHGILYDMTLAAVSVSGYSIIGCQIRKNTLGGIGITLASEGNVDQLLIASSSITANTGNGISFTATGTAIVTNLKIADNIIQDNTGYGINFSSSVTTGEVDSFCGNDSTTNQTYGLVVASGKTITGVKFSGTYTGATGAVNIAGTLTSTCSIATPTVGWTRNTGAPTASAPIGTLYQRSDGASGSLLYINTNGSTTWSAIA